MEFVLTEGLNDAGAISRCGVTAVGTAEFISVVSPTDTRTGKVHNVWRREKWVSR